MTEQNDFNEEKIDEKAKLLKDSIRDFRMLFGEKSLQILIFGEGFPENEECWKSNYSDCGNCLNN